MSPLSTGEVAKLVGVHRVTLENWLRKGKLKRPKTTKVGGLTYRFWTNRDIERIRAFKEKFYRKGRGRKPKPKVA
jgi:excisionase family DNA binding protein